MNTINPEYKQQILDALNCQPYRAKDMANLLGISSYRIGGALCRQLADEKKINILCKVDARGHEIHVYTLPEEGTAGGRTIPAYNNTRNNKLHYPQQGTGGAVVRAMIEAYEKRTLILLIESQRSHIVVYQTTISIRAFTNHSQNRYTKDFIFRPVCGIL